MIPSRASKDGWNYLGLLVVLLALILIFSLASDHFFSVLTLRSIANQIPALTVIAVGMTFVLVVAGIDLSVGSVAALAGACLGVALIDWQLSLWSAATLAVSTGLVCGVFNGLIVGRWAIPSFIVTLGMLEIARGGAYLATGSQTKYVGSAIETLGAPLNGIGLSPALIAALIVVLGGHVILKRTLFGRFATAIGSNEEAARLTGIRVNHYKFGVFCLSGLLAGIGGLFQVAYLQSADPNAGIGLELSAIAAVVIGGTSLAGGKGSVINSFLGVLIIAVLQAGLAQVGVSEPSKRVITGAVIIIAVILDAYRNRSDGMTATLLKALKR